MRRMGVIMGANERRVRVVIMRGNTAASERHCNAGKQGGRSWVDDIIMQVNKWRQDYNVKGGIVL
jgi:hypothetical protein